MGSQLSQNIVKPKVHVSFMRRRLNVPCASRHGMNEVCSLMKYSASPHGEAPLCACIPCQWRALDAPLTTLYIIASMNLLQYSKYKCNRLKS